MFFKIKFKFFLGQTFQLKRLPSSSRPTHLRNHFTFSSSMKTLTLNKKTYNFLKVIYNILMPISFGPTVNLIEIPRVPLEHKFK